MVARTPSGEVMTCDGCGAPVEAVEAAMWHPTPPALYVPQQAGDPVLYLVCRPLPDGTQPCLTLAHLADEVHLTTCGTCRTALGPGRLDVVMKFLRDPPPGDPRRQQSGPDGPGEPERNTA